MLTYYVLFFISLMLLFSLQYFVCNVQKKKVINSERKKNLIETINCVIVAIDLNC